MTTRPSRRSSLASACLLHAVVIGGAYMSLPPLFAEIAEQEGWSLRALQQAWAFVALGSGLVALPVGQLLRRRPDRMILGIAGALAVTAIALRALASDPLWLSAAMLVFGVGTGAMLVTLTSRVARHFESDTAGLAQAAFFGAYTIGAALGLITADLLASQLGGWRGVSLLWGGLSAASLLPALRESMPPPQASAVTAPHAKVPTAGLGRSVAPYALVYACYVGGYLGLTGLLPYQLRRWGWDPVLADSALACSTLGFIAGSFALAAITDRFGHRRATFAACMGLTALLTLVASATAPGGATLGTVCAITGVGFFGGAMALCFPIVLDDPATGGRHATLSIGIATAASYLGGFVIPFSLAPFSDTFPTTVLTGYAAAFGCAGVFIMLAATCATGPTSRG